MKDINNASGEESAKHNKWIQRKKLELVNILRYLGGIIRNDSDDGTKEKISRI